MLKTICAQPHTNANARVAQHTNATCTRTPHKHPHLHLHCTHMLHLFESYLRVARCALCATLLAPTNASHKHSHTCTPTHSQHTIASDHTPAHLGAHPLGKGLRVIETSLPQPRLDADRLCVPVLPVHLTEQSSLGSHAKTRQDKNRGPQRHSATKGEP